MRIFKIFMIVFQQSCLPPASTPHKSLGSQEQELQVRTSTLENEDLLVMAHFDHHVDFVEDANVVFVIKIPRSLALAPRDISVGGQMDRRSSAVEVRGGSGVANRNDSMKVESEPKVRSLDIEKVSDIPNTPIPASQVYVDGTRKVIDFAIVPEGAEVFRGMNVTRDIANKILLEGFESPALFHRGTSVVKKDANVLNTLQLHQKGEEGTGSTANSLFVSTTHSRDIAMDFAKGSDGGFVFKIRASQDQGIDMNRARGNSASQYENEQEVSFAVRIPKENVLGYFPVVKGPPRRLGFFKCNSPCVDVTEQQTFSIDPQPRRTLQRRDSF